MSDAGDYREVRGVMATGAPDKGVHRIVLADHVDYAVLDLCGFSSSNLTPEECRVLARDLYRTARRIEARQQ